ncbi:MAG TPA: hypothetical protein VFW98_18480 [Gemmatimonadaceae bacterium]|nr:hypothetical protein [Gemmatimonadaceae bacterium]
MPQHRPPLTPLFRALDEARFGAERTLNLHTALPSPYHAARRAEMWLREQQVASAGEVLVITGRGSHSADNVSVVREAIVKLLASLRRRGVVSGVEEHGPGSFVVRLAPVTALRDAPRRRRERTPPRVADPRALAGLSDDTRELLRALAMRALEELRIDTPDRFLESEMRAQFASLAPSVPEGPDHEARFRAAIAAALAVYDDG